MDNGNDKIVDKITKLLAVANCGGASENERETAMRQAYSMMAKHNMSIESINQEKNPREIQFQEGHGMAWARVIASAVAKLFFCSYVRGSSRKVNQCVHMFVGKRSNAIVAKDLATFLINSTFREGSRRMKAEGGAKPYAWRMDFGKGVSVSITVRCADLRAQKEAEFGTPSATGTGIVLANYYALENEANKKFMEDAMNVKYNKNRSREVNNHNAFNSGREFGNSLPLAGGLKDHGKGQLKIK